MERNSSLSELARHGFEELSVTLGRLEELVKLVGGQGHTALGYLSEAASPDKALLGLIKLAEVQPKQTAKMLGKERSARRLIKILGASDALLDHLLRFPEQIVRIAGASEFPSHDVALDHFRRTINPADESAPDLLRIEYRNLLLEVAALDLEPEDPTANFEATAASLSDLASATLEFALGIARLELVKAEKYDHSAVNDTKLSIIAMGKCGARELNYISDVDVIFAFEGNHEQSNEIATKLATRCMRIIDSAGSEPPLWQVDPNLRPEGKSGALVRSIESHVAYYQRWAENWEFQALLKARPVAGDVDLGQRYVREVKSLIWTNVNRGNLVDSVRRMRGRVLEHIPADERERQIKLGRGGLRDVEFTAQLLQMVHGIEDETLRVSDTLSALGVLAQAGYLGRQDAAEFARCYRTLRTIEHRVQLSKMRRSHLLPVDPSEQRRIARAFGPSVQIEQVWAQTRASVSALHESVFYRPLLNAMANLDTGEVRLTDDEVKLRLDALGFSDSAGAVRHISALTTGVSRRATIQRTLLPVLIRWLAEGVYPDRGLLSFRRLSEQLGETPWFLRMIRDSAGAAEKLMKLLSSSELVANLLEHIPEAASWLDSDEMLEPRTGQDLENEFSAILDRNFNIEDAAESLRYVRRREVLRLAMASVLGLISIEAISRSITELTDAYLLAMLGLAYKAADAEPNSFQILIVAMGRYGGSEIGFGSDADVILVRGDANADSGEEYVNRQASRVISELLVLVKDSLVAFELDLDLRPEGKQGAPIRTMDSYQAYYERWADLWEFQALLRARPLTADSALGIEFSQLIDKFRYPAALTERQVLEIRRIKARVESERLPQGADPLRHLKLGRGSLSDVEWTAQLFQLQHAQRLVQFRTTGTLQALNAARDAALMTPAEHEALVAAWIFASRLRSSVVLASAKQSDSLPTDRSQLEALARIMEYPAGSASQLEEDYLGITRRSRAVFESLFLSA